MAEHKVRLSIKPTEEITVEDAEFLDLTRMGLIASGDLPAEPPVIKTSEAPAKGTDKKE